MSFPLTAWRGAIASRMQREPAAGGGQRSDVQAMIAAWQQGLPGSAWQADSDPPDAVALGQWMAEKMATSGGLKVRSAVPGGLYDRVVRYLAVEGVDVGHGLQRAEDGRAAAASRVRAEVADIRGLALALKRAERELLAEARGFNEGATGFTAATLAAAEDRAARLAAELGAACFDDPALARAARRAAG